MTAAIEADFKTAPYLHQLREFELSADVSARALLWQMRTGKTKVTIDTACHQYKQGTIDCVVIFAPNGVHENWLRREVPTHHWATIQRRALLWRTSELSKDAVNSITPGKQEAWYARKRRWLNSLKKGLKSPDLLWLSFNTESMTRDEIRSILSRVARQRKFMVVFDESDDWRTPGSKRTPMARALAKKAKTKRILTGTVITNSPLAAWSQFELLQPNALGFSKYGDFKRHHAEYEILRTKAGRSYPSLVGYRNLDELTDRMAKWSSVVLREDCEDLPDVVPYVRDIVPSSQQLAAYRELHKAFEIELGDKKVSIGENTSRLTKLQQVMSGFLIDEFGDVHDIPGTNPRLEAISDEVYLSPGKVIVWCMFREDIDRVAKRLRADGHKIVEYHGRVSDEAKQQALDDFRDDPEVKGLIGQPGSGGRGLDMSAASDIFNYSHTFNAIHREQSIERATAIGGKNIRATDFIAPGPDLYIRDNVKNKIEIADAVAGHGMKRVLELCQV